MINSCKVFQILTLSGLLTTLLTIIVPQTAPITQAQEEPSQAQQEALKIVTQLMTQQKPYYQEHQQFNTDVKKIAKEQDLTLSPSFNYGIRTALNTAYIYVMPAKTPMADQLKSYIGAVTFDPDNPSDMKMILCENTELGRIRPADPQKTSDNSQAWKCGNKSQPVSISEKEK
jgi:hypothetical protein